MTDIRDPLPIHSPGGSGTTAQDQQPGVIPAAAGGANKPAPEARHDAAGEHLLEHARLRADQGAALALEHAASQAGHAALGAIARTGRLP